MVYIIPKVNFYFFLDDDIQLNPWFIQNYKESIIKYPNLVLCGRIEGNANTGLNPPGKIDFNTGKIITQFDFSIIEPIFFGGGGNFCIPRALLPDYPAFCPQFKGAALGEEIDFFFKVNKFSNQSISLPSSKIFHLNASQGGCRDFNFNVNFLKNLCFNQALFYSKNISKKSIWALLYGLKGELEYYTRNKRTEHSFLHKFQRRNWLLLIKATSQILLGFFAGLKSSS